MKTLGKIIKAIAIIYAVIFIALLGMILMTNMMLAGLQ